VDREVGAEIAGRRVVLMDSVSVIGPEDDGQVAVTGSHGGRSAGGYASRQRPFAVFFNDAGVGKDRAGLAGLAILEAHGVPAGTVSHLSARIGDARDSWESGVISHLNRPALAAGFEVGRRLREAIEAVLGE
jgi:hypothetical protein